MSKEEEIKQKYEEELMRSHEDVEQLTKQLNQIALDRNQLVQERSQLIAQAHAEFERAERYVIKAIMCIFSVCHYNLHAFTIDQGLCLYIAMYFLMNGTEGIIHHYCSFSLSGGLPSLTYCYLSANYYLVCYDVVLLVVIDSCVQ